MGYNKGVIIYALKSVLSITTSFLSHWYGGGLRVAAFSFGDILRAIDERFVIREVLRETFIFDVRAGVIGNVKGFARRTPIIFGVGLFYAFLALIFLALYLLWATVPLYLIYKIFNPR